MMWLKSCPRCRGDLLADSDYYSRYLTCIQCGETLEESQQSIVQETVFGKRSRPGRRKQSHRLKRRRW